MNDPERLARTLGALEGVKSAFDGAASGNKRVSMADLIVLGGVAAVERAAHDAGVEVTVPFVPGRMDTTDELTDAESFEWLRPVVDGFRNYRDAEVRFGVPDEQLFLDRAALLTLTAPEWTALAGGLKVLGIDHDGSSHGLFTDRPGVLTNDFFRTLTSMDHEWKPRDASERAFDIVDRETGETRYIATRCDLIFGANAQLRHTAEVYAADDGHARLVHDFVAAWHKVMMLDRYDVPEARAKAVSVCRAFP